MTDTANPTKSPLAAEYTAAGGLAIRLLTKASQWFKSQGYLVRADVLWPEDQPRYAFRWDPHAAGDTLGFLFHRLAIDDGPDSPRHRREWVPIVGAIASPSHPMVEEITPILATLRMLPALKVEAELARDHALRALRDGAEEMEAWLVEVAPPVKSETYPSASTVGRGPLPPTNEQRRVT